MYTVIAHRSARSIFGESIMPVKDVNRELLEFDTKPEAQAWCDMRHAKQHTQNVTYTPYKGK